MNSLSSFKPSMPGCLAIANASADIDVACAAMIWPSASAVDLSVISGLGGLFVYGSFQAYHRGADFLSKEHGSQPAFAGSNIEVVHGCDRYVHGCYLASRAGVGA